jgi:hypothetical protein
MYECIYECIMYMNFIAMYTYLYIKGREGLSENSRLIPVMNINMYGCIHTFMMYYYMYMLICIRLYVHIYVYMSIYMSIYMYIYMNIYTYIYIYINIHEHIYIHTPSRRFIEMS